MSSSEPDRARADDPVVRGIESFEVFYRRTYRRLLGLAIVLSGDRQVAEDIVQDSMAAALRSWNRVSALDDPDAWVKRVVANRSVSVFRRTASEVKALARLGGTDEGTTDPALAEALELWEVVRRLLPRRQTVAVALRYAGELGLGEIAAVMECSTSTVNTHLRRAHERLSRELGKEWKEDW